MGLKVFLSYGHDANAALVQRIRADLDAAGHIPDRHCKNQICQRLAARNPRGHHRQRLRAGLPFEAYHLRSGVCLDAIVSGMHDGPPCCSQISPQCPRRVSIFFLADCGAHHGRKCNNRLWRGEQMMKIPVFVSCPTSLNPVQEDARKTILRFLMTLISNSGWVGQIIPRSSHCVKCWSSHVTVPAELSWIQQFRATAGAWNPGGPRSPGRNGHSSPMRPVSFPTPWNQLEAGVLFGLGLPMLIFTECLGDRCISGGVFDKGVTDVFVNKVPTATLQRDEEAALKHVS